VTATFPEQHSGFFGIGVPSGHALAETFFGRRGLFVVSPVLLLAVAGLVALGRRRFRAEAAAAGAVTLAFAVLAAGYFDPYGGLSPGPRYFAPALLFLALGLPEAFRRWPRGGPAPPVHGRSWRVPELKNRNVSTQIFLVPNVPRKLGFWEHRGTIHRDYTFVEEAARLQGGPVFVDEATVRVRPIRNPVQRVVRARALPGGSRNSAPGAPR
jgi:hypothetical protein